MAKVHDKKSKAGFLATIRELFFLLTVVFLVRTFGFGLYQVPTGSMETTMLVGERFFADKFTILFSPPCRGQIIAFNDPTYRYSDNKIMNLFENYFWGPSNWTKRVIGIPGDRIKGVIEDGKPVIYLNDKKLNEPYLNEYPLIALWSENPLAIKERAEKEARELIMKRQLTFADVEAYVNYEMQRSWLWRPYVAKKPFEQQPYYTMQEDRIVRIDPGTPVPGLKITEDGMLLKEPFTPRPSTDANDTMRNGNSHWNGTDEFSVELGPDQYWLMGDNRRGSSDCRVFGPINKKIIHGKIIFRIWSSDSTESWWILDLIKHPVDFWKRMRWNRFFQVVC